jgi:SET domain-containing protein
MILVRTFLSTSSIHGMGLFAAENIRKGSLIWQYHPNTTQVFWKRQFLAKCFSMPLSASLEFVNYSYVKEGNIYYLNDNLKFINHAPNPNVEFNSYKSRVALRDIEKGEELTENYLSSYDEGEFLSWRLPKDISSNDELIIRLKELLLADCKLKSA